MGALVGSPLFGTVKNPYVTGTVSGGVDSYVGGLEGINAGSTIVNSHAAVSVSGSGAKMVGGLVGYNEGVCPPCEDMLVQSYATGTVSGGDGTIVGGLVGQNVDATILNSYSSASVAGGSNVSVGGLIGQDVASAQTSGTYWDMDTSGIADPHQGAGNIVDDPGITGLTTEQLKSALPAGFDPSLWKEKARLNTGYPYLIDNQPSK